MTLVQLQQKREQLLKSLGISAVEYRDRRTQFSGDADKLKALAAIDHEIAALETPTRSRVRKAYMGSKGY